MKKKIVYAVLFFALCLVPSLGMFVTEEEASSENRDLAEFPALSDEEGLNTDWLSDVGDYFQDHFAFRNELVTANALVNGKILGTSTASGVIQGTGGWLYYMDSLSDYQGTELLSDRSLFNIAHSLSLMQEYLEGKGVDFVFTVAPNKNSLYPENMPYYYQTKASEEKNLVNLVPYLEEQGVNYVNLYETLSSQDEVLYHKRDSHWDNRGASLAADTLLDALGKEHEAWTDEAYEVRTDYEGDLDEMLYPNATTLEDEYYYDRQTTFAYVGEVSSNFEPKITTVNPVKSGSLIVYRDSFGNALLPFLADAYANAYFSRGIPYQLSDVDTQAADTVIVERAERFLPDMAQDPPQMVGPAIVPESLLTETATDGASDIVKKDMGTMVQITGRIDAEYLDTETEIYLRVNSAGVYEAFPMDVVLDDGTTDSGGFCLYLYTASLKEGENTLEIVVKDQEEYRIIASTVIEEETTNEE